LACAVAIGTSLAQEPAKLAVLPLNPKLGIELRERNSQFELKTGTST
jgi:hypothetical protein